MFSFTSVQKLCVSKNLSAGTVKDMFTNFTYGCGKAELVDLSEDNTVIVGSASAVEIGDAEYVVGVCESGAYIHGIDKSALIRGYIDFLSHITPICLEIGKEMFEAKTGIFYGKPDISFRAVHFCVFPETDLSYLDKCIKFAAALNYTHVVIEFWGMYRFNVIRELSWQTSYTKEQIKPIIDNAHALGLEIIPMFNHLGHASASRLFSGKHVVLDQNPRLATLFTSDGWMWRFKDEKVREILKAVRKELIDLCGEGKYFLLGCDEAYPFVQNKKNSEAFAEYLNEIQAELEIAGRTAIIWGDMFLDAKAFDPTGKTQYAANLKDKSILDALDKLNKNIIIADWQYEIHEIPWKTSLFFKEKGFKVICCPWDNKYNIESAVLTAKNEGLYGIMHTTWHTLKTAGGVPNMAYAGTCAYDYENRTKDYWGEHFAVTQTLLRKMCPPHGEYGKAGWTEIQAICNV